MQKHGAHFLADTVIRALIQVHTYLCVSVRSTVLSVPVLRNPRSLNRAISASAMRVTAQVPKMIHKLTYGVPISIPSRKDFPRANATNRDTTAQSPNLC